MLLASYAHLFHDTSIIHNLLHINDLIENISWLRFHCRYQRLIFKGVGAPFALKITQHFFTSTIVLFISNVMSTNSRFCTLVTLLRTFLTDWMRIPYSIRTTQLFLLPSTAKPTSNRRIGSGWAYTNQSMKYPWNPTLLILGAAFLSIPLTVPMPPPLLIWMHTTAHCMHSSDLISISAANRFP